MIRDGPGFTKPNDLAALRREDLVAAKEAKENAQKVTKENLKATNIKKARKEEKTDHDPNHETDEIIETVLRPHDETVPVGAAAQAPQGLVHLVLKHDLKRFAYFTITGYARVRRKIALLHIIPLANSTPLQTVAETVTNVFHHTEREVASWLCDLLSASVRHPSKRRNLLMHRNLHLKQKRKQK